MNWGIFSLLAVVVFVLGSIASFFIYLARRSVAVAAGTAAALRRESAGATWAYRQSAPGSGGGNVRKHWNIGTLQPVAGAEPRCARGRAQSGPAGWCSSVRRAGPKPPHPTL